MPKPQQIKPSAMFGGAGTSQQVYQLKGEIDELQAEVERLRTGELGAEERQQFEAKIQTLITELSAQGGERLVAIGDITRNPLQPRVVFPSASLRAFANVLKEEGQLSPIILIELTDENHQQLKDAVEQGLFSLDQPFFNLNSRYILFDGERRWRSAPLAEMGTLRAVTLPAQESLDLLTLQAKALSTTIHAKRLHDLELAQTLIYQVKHRHADLVVEGTPDEVFPRALNNALTRMKRGGKVADLKSVTTADREEQVRWLTTIDLNPVEKAVLDTILYFQQNPSTVSRNLFPMLKLPPDLKEAVWAEGLEPSKLKVLAQINPEALQSSEAEALQVRSEFTQKTIAEGWSLEVLRTQVQAMLLSANPASTPKPAKALKVLGRIDVAQMPPDQLGQCREALTRLLAEVEQRLANG